MPISSPACRSFSVTSLSSRDTSRLPLGWLWARMIDAARSSRAFANISRGCMRLWSSVPINTTVLSITLFAPSSVSIAKHSCFLVARNLSSSKASFGHVMTGRSGGMRYRRPSSKSAMISHVFAGPIPGTLRTSSYETALPCSFSSLSKRFEICSAEVRRLPLPIRIRSSSISVSLSAPKRSSFSLGSSLAMVTSRFSVKLIVKYTIILSIKDRNIVKLIQVSLADNKYWIKGATSDCIHSGYRVCDNGP